MEVQRAQRVTDAALIGRILLGERVRNCRLERFGLGVEVLHVLIAYVIAPQASSKQGTYVRYGIADASVFDLCEQVCGGLRQQVTELDQILTGGIA